MGLDEVIASIKEAVRDGIYLNPPAIIGKGRAAVRDRLRQLLADPSGTLHRLLDRAEFDRLCEEVGNISDNCALLDFLHQTGVVFFRPGLFDDRIVLDQNWALEAIYALFDPNKTLPLLRGRGRFTRADLERLIWSSYTTAEQNTFLSMMESCGICFKAQELANGEWAYVAPELLPDRVGVEEQLVGRLRDDPPRSMRRAHYDFLHEGILRSYLSKLGQYAKDAAVYWKYGCWFSEKKTGSVTLIESNWDDPESEIGSGAIQIQAWGNQADDLVRALVEALLNLPLGHSPDVTVEYQSAQRR